MTVLRFHGKDVGDSKKNGREFQDDLDDDDESICSGDYDDETDVDLIRAKRAQREHPLRIDNMNEIKSNFEAGMEQGREARHNERKQEIQNIRSRLFFGKQARTKEMYQNAVSELETTTKLRNKGFVIGHELHDVKAAAEKAQNIKQRFETGDVYRKSNSIDDEEFDGHVNSQDKNASKGAITSKISNKVSERMQMLAKQQVSRNEKLSLVNVMCYKMLQMM